MECHLRLEQPHAQDPRVLPEEVVSQLACMGPCSVRGAGGVWCVVGVLDGYSWLLLQHPHGQEHWQLLRQPGV